MLYISSALSLYYPWDFCMYEGMTALASHFFSYIPFIVAVIIVSIVLKYGYHIDRLFASKLHACVSVTIISDQDCKN